MNSQSQLFQVVFALCSTGRFPGLLHGGQQQGNQDGNDGDDDKQFDQREATPTLRRQGRREKKADHSDSCVHEDVVPRQALLRSGSNGDGRRRM